ncbi:MAG TPA: hypothetical protein ENK37_09610 [Oceanithermus profundus]|uniref:Uncharacterized protein n=1 Tax=Oceanithermus profundus TaxID=187137 RepID=A0A7C4V6T8_9DEIN|nr:hypothetical protein [Oceanithermus profundus]
MFVIPDEPAQPVRSGILWLPPIFLHLRRLAKEQSGGKAGLYRGFTPDLFFVIPDEARSAEVGDLAVVAYAK